MNKDNFYQEITIKASGDSLPQAQLIKASLAVMFFEAIAKMVNGGAISSIRELRDCIGGSGAMICTAGMLLNEMPGMPEDATLDDLQKLIGYFLETAKEERDGIEKEIKESEA